MTDGPPIRDAATVVIVREGSHVLMGQRGKGAVFMPNKFVFPGGAMDENDYAVPLARPLATETHARLERHAPSGIASGLAVAAIREVWEESGLRLGIHDNTTPLPEAWSHFGGEGWRPDASAMRFFFRAITPPGRPRRFDARFFLVPAEALAGDLDDFSEADDELAHLAWVPLSEARSLDLPFITSVVLAELDALIASGGRPAHVPFFHMKDGRPTALDLA